MLDRPKELDSVLHRKVFDLCGIWWTRLRRNADVLEEFLNAAR
jgi:hypothetical protein